MTTDTNFSEGLTGRMAFIPLSGTDALSTESQEKLRRKIKQELNDFFNMYLSDEEMAAIKPTPALTGTTDSRDVYSCSSTANWVPQNGVICYLNHVSRGLEKPSFKKISF